MQNTRNAGKIGPDIWKVTKLQMQITLTELKRIKVNIKFQDIPPIETNHLVHSPEETKCEEGSTTNTYLERKAMIPTRTGLAQTKETINDLNMT